MKVKNQDLAEHGTDNDKHRQEDAASRDYAKQREAVVRDADARNDKPKKSHK